MRTIPARPVQYQGIQFRSVEEARWAAFFNRLGINFEYEKQVEGLYYLPDFFVPSQRTFPKATFFEVKPVLDVVEEEKCWMLEEKEKTRVVILRKMAWLRGVKHLDLSGLVCAHEVLGDYGYAFCQCQTCKAYGVEFEGRADRIGCPCKKSTDRGHNYNCESLLVAYAHAMTLKF